MTSASAATNVYGPASKAAIEYDEPSRKLMDKYNEGTLLGGGVGNA